MRFKADIGFGGCTSYYRCSDAICAGQSLCGSVAGWWQGRDCRAESESELGDIQYNLMHPTAASRIIEKKVRMAVRNTGKTEHTFRASSYAAWYCI